VCEGETEKERERETERKRERERQRQRERQRERERERVRERGKGVVYAPTTCPFNFTHREGWSKVTRKTNTHCSTICLHALL
jgi:hypothetical protein